MVVGCGVVDDDRLPLPVEDGGTVECVSQLPYLSFLVAESSRSNEEVDRRIANASKSLWGIEASCFQGQQFVSKDIEKCVQLLCDVGAAVWK